jgi:hypothetical protein
VSVKAIAVTAPARFKKLVAGMIVLLFVEAPAGAEHRAGPACP